MQGSKGSDEGSSFLLFAQQLLGVQFGPYPGSYKGDNKGNIKVLLGGLLRSIIRVICKFYWS